MTEINVIHTPCKNCAFAKYEDKTQTDCEMGLLQKARDNKTEILEAYDEDKEFYVINGKKCLAHKEANYFDARNMGDATLEEKISYVKKLMQVKYIAIIDCLSRNEQQLIDILNELKKAETQPDRIMVVSTRFNSTSLETFYKILNKSGIKWKIKSLPTTEQDHIRTVHEVINLGTEKCNYVLSVQEDYSKIPEIIQEANKIIYEQNSMFHVLSNESKETIFFNCSVYRAGLLPEHTDIITNYEKYTIV